jgi:hypothetical protein
MGTMLPAGQSNPTSAVGWVAREHLDLIPMAPTQAADINTWTDDGKLIAAYNGTFLDSLNAELLSPAIAKFETSGCTPWIKGG